MSTDIGTTNQNAHALDAAQTRARQGKMASLILLSLLIALITAEIWLLAPVRLRIFLTVLQALPLALFFRPIQQAKAMSTVWLSFLLMPYFCWAVLGAYQPGAAGGFAIARAVLIGACFISAILFTRWQRAVDEHSY